MEVAVAAVAALGVGTVGVAGFANAKSGGRRVAAAVPSAIALAATEAAAVGRGADDRSGEEVFSAYLEFGDGTAGNGQKNLATFSEGVLMLGPASAEGDGSEAAATDPVLFLGDQDVKMKGTTITILAEPPKPVVLKFDTADDATTWARALQRYQTDMRANLEREAHKRGSSLEPGKSVLPARVAELCHRLVAKESLISSLEERIDTSKRKEEELEEEKFQDELARQVRESQVAKVQALERKLRTLSEKSANGLRDASRLQAKLQQLQPPDDDGIMVRQIESLERELIAFRGVAGSMDISKARSPVPTAGAVAAQGLVLPVRWKFVGVPGSTGWSKAENAVDAYSELDRLGSQEARRPVVLRIRNEEHTHPSSIKAMQALAPFVATGVEKGRSALMVRKTIMVEATHARLPVVTLRFHMDDGQNLGARIDMADSVKVCVPNYKPKSYSCSMTPDMLGRANNLQPGEFEITTKGYGGRASGFLHRLEVGDPMHVFASGKKERNPGAFVGIVAYGVGITEGLPLAEAELVKGDARSVVLLWSARCRGETWWQDRVEELKAKHPGRFSVTYAFSREQREGCVFGRVDKNVLVDVFDGAWGAQSLGAEEPRWGTEARFITTGTKEMMKATDHIYSELNYPMPEYALLAKPDSERHYNDEHHEHEVNPPIVQSPQAPPAVYSGAPPMAVYSGAPPAAVYSGAPSQATGQIDNAARDALMGAQARLQDLLQAADSNAGRMQGIEDELAQIQNLEVTPANSVPNSARGLLGVSGVKGASGASGGDLSGVAQALAATTAVPVGTMASIGNLQQMLERALKSVETTSAKSVQLQDAVMKLQKSNAEAQSASEVQFRSHTAEPNTENRESDLTRRLEVAEAKRLDVERRAAELERRVMAAETTAVKGAPLSGEKEELNRRLSAVEAKREALQSRVLQLEGELDQAQTQSVSQAPTVYSSPAPMVYSSPAPMVYAGAPPPLVEDKIQELNEIRMQLQDAQSKGRASNAQIDDLMSERDRLQRAQNESNRQKEAAEEQVRAMSRDLDAQQEEILQSKRAVNDIREQAVTVGLAQAEASALQAKIDTLGAERDGLLKDQDAFTHRIATANAGQAEAQSQVTGLMRDISERDEVIRQHERALDDVRNQTLAEHQQHLGNLQQASLDAQAKARELQRSLEGQEQATLQERAQNADLTAKLRGTEEDLRQSQLSLRQLEEDAAAGNQAAGLAERLQQTEEQVRQEQTKARELEGQYARVSEVARQHEVQLAQMQQEAGRKDDLCSQFNQQAGEMQVALDEAMLMRTNLTQSLQASEVQVESLQREQSRHASMLEERERRVGQAEAQAAQSDEDARRLQDRASQQEEQVRRLQDEADESRRSASESRRALEDARAAQTRSSSNDEEQRKLLARVGELEAKLNVAKDESLSLKQQKMDSESKTTLLTKEFEAEYVTIRRNLNEEKRQKEAAEDRARLAEQKVSVANDRTETLTRDRDSLTRRVTSAESSARSGPTREEAAAVEQRATAAEAQKRQLEQEMRAMTKTTADLQALLKSANEVDRSPIQDPRMQERVQALEREKQAAESRAREASSQITILELERNGFQKQLSTQTAEFDDLRKRFQQRDEGSPVKELEMRRLADENSSLKNELSTTWQKIDFQTKKIEEERAAFWEELEAVRKKTTADAAQPKRPPAVSTMDYTSTTRPLGGLSSDPHSSPARKPGDMLTPPLSVSRGQHPSTSSPTSSSAASGPLSRADLGRPKAPGSSPYPSAIRPAPSVGTTLSGSARSGVSYPSAIGPGRTGSALGTSGLGVPLRRSGDSLGAARDSSGSGGTRRYG